MLLIKHENLDQYISEVKKFWKSVGMKCFVRFVHEFYIFIFKCNMSYGLIISIDSIQKEDILN